MSRHLFTAVAAALAAGVARAEPPDFDPDDFPPNEVMDVFVVPHRTWREGDHAALGRHPRYSREGRHYA